MGSKIDGEATEAGVGGDGGVEVPGTEVVQGQLGVWEEEVPEVEGKMRVERGYDRNKMILKSSNMALSRVGPVVVRRDILDTGGRAEGLKECSQGRTRFVVRNYVGYDMAVGGEKS